jgi:hypothetical protein
LQKILLELRKLNQANNHPTGDNPKNVPHPAPGKLSALFLYSFSVLGSVRFKQLSVCIFGILPIISYVSLLQEITGDGSSRSL